MNLLNRLTIKNLKLNKKRTIVTIMGIILSVALIMAVASMYSSLIASLIKYEIKEKGNYHVAFHDVDTTDLVNFENNQAVEDYYLVENIGYAVLEGIQNENKPYVYLKSFSDEAFTNIAPTLIEGRLPQNSREIVIPSHLDTNGRVKLKVGDTISLKVGERITSDGNVLTQDNPLEINEEGLSQEQIINTKSLTYKVVGITTRPATSIESFTAPGYTFITKNEKVANKNVDVFVLYNKKGLRNNEKVTAGLKDINNYNISQNSYLINLQTDPFKDPTIGSFGLVIGVVALIIVFTSVFCIKNSFDISITEKIKQYGMLKSIGATKRQIKNNVFYEATILGVIGIPLGLLSGLLASYILIGVSNYFLGPSFNEEITLIFAFSFKALIVSIILGIITIYFSAFNSAKRAKKVSPIEAIRNSAALKIKPKSIKSNKIIKKLFGIGGDISYKNMKRNKKKYRTTIISITVSTFVFIALSYFMSMAFVSINDELGAVDYNLTLSTAATNEKLIKEVTKLDNIKDYTIEKRTYFNILNPQYKKSYIKGTKVDIKDKDFYDGYIYLVSLGDNQYQKYLKELNLDIKEVKDKAILYNNVIYTYFDAKSNKTKDLYLEEFDYEKGNTLELKNSVGEVSNLEIAYVTDKLPFAISKNTEQAIIFVSDEVMARYQNDNSYIYAYFDATNPNKLQDNIDEVFKSTNYNLNNMEENAKMMHNIFTLIGIFLYGFIIVISLIGITNIFNTITTNMELRRQEFAMLKSVGMTNKEFKRMIRLESIFIGLKSLSFGIVIGIILSYIIYKALDVNSKFIIPYKGILIAIIAVYLLITIIMKYSLSKINKQNTIETIRNENI